MNGYHFTANTLRNGEPLPAIGEWLEHEGKIVPCETGLHASEHPFDAMQYAPGNLLHRVELEGELQPHGEPIDKWVGRRRRIVATIAAESLLRDFARWCALQVIDLWDGPAVVREYLETGDESKRAAAREAATGAWTATRYLARGAVWDAARAAAAAAATAAGDASRSATWAARDAARASAAAAATAAGDASRSATWAARDAACCGRHRDAASMSAREAQRDRVAKMVNEAFDAASVDVQKGEL